MKNIKSDIAANKAERPPFLLLEHVYFKMAMAKS